MPTMSFKERLKQGIILTDGATSTLVYQRHPRLEASFDAINITDPSAMLRIHRDYVRAGAEIIEANTFGANRYNLQQQGLADQLEQINRRGVELARQSTDEASKDVYVAGEVGPLDARMAPTGRLQPEQVKEIFAEQIEILIDSGVDLLSIKTFTQLNELAVAVEAARSVSSDIPIMAQVSFNRDDRLAFGGSAMQAAQAMKELDADIVGINSSFGAAQVARMIATFRSIMPDRPLAAIPNAGWPEYIAGRVVYPAGSEYFADYAVAFREFGITVTGGCFGTTPEHIQAMRIALDAPSFETSISIRMPKRSTSGHVAEEQPDPSDLARKLKAGDFVVAVEVSPPKGIDMGKVLEAAHTLKQAGVDALDISDSPMARMRMSPWAVCNILQTNVNIDTVLHFPTRGRNLLRVQGDLLAAHAIGVRNLFVVMGDPTKIGDYPDANDDFDIPPSSLVGLVKKNLNQSQDWSGSEIGQPTNFLVSCALNLDPRDMERELRVLGKKLNNGADYLLTQPIYEIDVYHRFMQAYEDANGEVLQVPVLVGLLPLNNSRHARFLNNEVPGINIPEHIMERIQGAGKSAAQEGVRIAQELAIQLRDAGAAGLYVIPQFGRYDLAAEIVEAVKQPLSLS